MNKAFITYLCNDYFIEGAIALANSIKSTQSKYPIACMVTSDVTQEGRQRLTDVGFDLLDIEKIIPKRVSGIKDRYKDNSWMMFTKLNLWRQLEYEKLVFIDADCLVLQNIDEMIDFPSVSAVKDIGYGGISAGVMVLEPSQKMFDDLMNNLDNDVYDNTYSDQSYLNWYLKDRKIWNEIPIQYNVLQKRIPFRPGIKIYHYNGQNPWITDPDHSCCWRKGNIEIYKLWNYYYMLEQK